MSGKVYSVSIGNRRSLKSLNSPVLYRVYTSDARISPEGAECVLWSQVIVFHVHRKYQIKIKLILYLIIRNTLHKLCSFIKIIWIN